MTADNPVTRTDVDKALLGSATYRSLGEQRLTPAEERFEKGRRTVGLFLAPWGWLEWPVYVLAVLTWLTVGQRILFVRRQLRELAEAQA